MKLRKKNSLFGKEWTFEDLRDKDIELLRKVFLSPEGTFVCLAMSYYPLKGLNLIDEENQITHDGRSFLRYINNAH
jgi:hypothetical protein